MVEFTKAYQGFAACKWAGTPQYMIDLCHVAEVLRADNVTAGITAVQRVQPASRAQDRNRLLGVCIIEEREGATFAEGWASGIENLLNEEGSQGLVLTVNNVTGSTNHAVSHAFECVPAVSRVNALAALNRAVGGTFPGVESGVGLLWQPRLLSYGLCVSIPSPFSRTSSVKQVFAWGSNPTLGFRDYDRP